MNTDVDALRRLYPELRDDQLGTVAETLRQYAVLAAEIVDVLERPALTHTGSSGTVSSGPVEPPTSIHIG